MINKHNCQYLFPIIAKNLIFHPNKKFMKKILFSLLVVASLASCKKDDEKISCDVSVAGIAGNYKITKATVKITSVPETEVTSSLFTSCELAGIYQLKADKTVVYTETAACGGSGAGTWDIVSGNITITNTSGNGTDFPLTSATTKVAGWDCTTLTLTEDPAAGQTYKYTLTKQ